LQRAGTLERTCALQRPGTLQRSSALQRSRALKRTSALERATALQRARCLLRSRRAGSTGRGRHLGRPSALQWPGALQRPATLQRAGALLRTDALLLTLTRLRSALAALSASRTLCLLGLSLLGRRWLGLRLFWRLRLRRCRHQQHRRCHNKLRPKCNFSHMDQPRRRGTPPLQPDFECLRPLGPLPLTKAGPTQADCQNTELHTTSQDLSGLHGVGRGSAVVMSDVLKAQPEQATIVYTV
jgi:hypothetical protein